MKDLVNRLLAELDVPTRDSKVCQGTLLSRAQYLVDVDEWGYEDARAAAARIDDGRADRGVDGGDRQDLSTERQLRRPAACHDQFTGRGPRTSPTTDLRPSV